MAEHRPSVVVQADVFPDDSFLLDDEEKMTYTPDDVAQEAWNDICGWVLNGYLPVVVVLMPDGSEHTVDLEEVAKEALSDDADGD